MDDEILYTGETVGIIGDSENGPMIVTAARRAGFQVGAYGPDETSPMLQLADFRFVGEYSDAQRLQDFSQSCDMVIIASEHLNAGVIETIKQYTRVPQGSDFQMMMQDRLLERAFYEQLNVNIPPYATIVSLDDVYQAINSIGYPSVLKPIQKDLEHGEELIINTQTDIAKANGLTDWGTYILESLVSYRRELAMTVARTADGDFKLFPPVGVVREGDQIQWAYTPIQLDPDVTIELERICREVVANIEYVGVFEIDFMITDAGSLYVKQIVPTFGPAGRIFDRATTVTQYEQHLRAIAGLPLSEPNITLPTAMGIFNESQLGALRTQWVLKANWHFTYYRLPPRNLPTGKRPAGNVILQGPNVAKLIDQLEDTGIWRSETDAEA
ncbi:ATP-grasp domain-containing protein [Secundilactobacillus kimchicus]|uniref:ATP-grasp domain-containing protein n=1 Tax=Secundilactobacillus kimchicus TaxID=528209 RepID=UPI00207918B8|nr:ATP-grasp domain-containing protein [Secundilactobacillus kimchicus]